MVDFAYFDTCVVVKLYEGGEGCYEQVENLFKEYTPCSSAILYVETISALARKRREGRLKQRGLDLALSLFKEDFEKICIIEVTRKLLDDAGEILLRHPLRAYDSIHLASAKVLETGLGSPIPFITSDKRLAKVAEEEGFNIILLKE